MKKSEAEELLKKAAGEQRLMLETKRTYWFWVRRYLEWCQGRIVSLSPCHEVRVSEFLSSIAPSSAESTQNQALNALVFFYRHAAGKPLGDLPAWSRAERPARLPEWLPYSEAMAVLAQLRDLSYLAAAIMYGAGLRIKEVSRLRLRDLNFEQASLTVRGGKGDKDRVTVMPVSLVDEIRAQATRARARWKEDRERDRPGVYVPLPVLRKQPNAPKELWYYWLFPSAQIAEDPEAPGQMRRHHVHADTFAKNFKVAARRAGITRRVTSHSLRHSFATQFLLNGGNIRDLSELLGHTNIETTMVYLHCLPRLETRIQSPLDARPLNIVPISPPTGMVPPLQIRAS